MVETKQNTRVRQPEASQVVPESTPIEKKVDEFMFKQNYGYDFFVGSSILPNNYKRFVTLNLKDGRPKYHETLKQTADSLCSLVKDNKKILLFKSPSKNDESEYVPWGKKKNETSYVPLSTDNMKWFMKLYNGRAEMRKHLNPFMHQPEGKETNLYVILSKEQLQK